MPVTYSFKVIFIIHIFFFFCKGIKIYVPKAPHNLKAHQIGDTYVDLKWIRSPTLNQQTHDLMSDESVLSENSEDCIQQQQHLKDVLIPAKKVIDSQKQYKAAHSTNYVLFYEEWLSKSNFVFFNGVQNYDQIKNFSIFQSDTDTVSYNWGLNHLTLLHIPSAGTAEVRFRLENLVPFTPYKIWVSAFHNFSLDDMDYSHLSKRLGPVSEPLYVWTEVRPPSGVKILNITCNQTNQFSGELSLAWHQPLEYDNSIDKYVINLLGLPEGEPRITFTLLSNKDNMETSYDFKVDTPCGKKYEVVIYAGTKSIVEENKCIHGEKSPPYVVTCGRHETVNVAELLRIPSLTIIVTFGITLLL